MPHKRPSKYDIEYGHMNITTRSGKCIDYPKYLDHMERIGDELFALGKQAPLHGSGARKLAEIIYENLARWRNIELAKKLGRKN